MSREGILYMGKKFPIVIRHATEEDLHSIQLLARQYSDQLGFVRRITLTEAPIDLDMNAPTANPSCDANCPLLNP